MRTTGGGAVGVLREIRDPFLVAAPTGAATRDRLRPTTAEAAALTEIGAHLGGLYRADYAQRAREGRLNPEDKVISRRERKRALTGLSSSRWAGAITRATEDQYNLGVRGLLAERTMLRDGVKAIERRLQVGPGTVHKPARGKPIRGYRNNSEWFQKTRRLNGLNHRLAQVDVRYNAGAPSMVHGGGRLWKNRSNLDTAGLTVDGWREQWDAARWFFTADGESGKKYGNQTIRVSPDGTVTVKVPAGLVEKYGTHLTLSTRLHLDTHRAPEWLARVEAHRAVAYKVWFNPVNNRWYLDAAWKTTPAPVVPLESLRAHRTLALDLNNEFLAGWVVDASGNPVGKPLTFTILTDGLSVTQRDANLRHAITRLLHHAQTHGCRSVTVENLNFADARSSGRETMGRGGKGKSFRRIVAGIPTGKFRQRLTAMANTIGLPIIAVDPAYTSRWSKQHWLKPLTIRNPNTTGHHAAALVIGRRAYGHTAKRRTEVLPTRQRTSGDSHQRSNTVSSVCPQGRLEAPFDTTDPSGSNGRRP